MTVTTFRNIAIGAVALGLLVLTPAVAHAEGPGASGSVGHVQALVNGRPIEIQPLAACASGGVLTANTPGATESGFVRFGSGSSTCRVEDTGAAGIEVSGSRFRFDGLRQFGGPIIRVNSFTVGCRATEAGSESSIRITGLSGISLPNPIPANHTVTIPSQEQDAPPLAKIVLNEVIQPNPPDGSMTVNLMHITLFPEGVSIHSGQIVAGTVSCSPDPDFAA